MVRQQLIATGPVQTGTACCQRRRDRPCYDCLAALGIAECKRCHLKSGLVSGSLVSLGWNATGWFHCHDAGGLRRFLKLTRNRVI